MIEEGVYKLGIIMSMVREFVRELIRKNLNDLIFIIIMKNYNLGNGNVKKSEWNRRVVLEIFIFILKFWFEIRYLRKIILWLSIGKKE